MLRINETCVNRTEGYHYGDSGVYETWTDNIGKLFRQLQKEFGRCEGKIYVDTSDNGTKQVGWVFARMSRYEDAKLKDKSAWYCREVWVTVHDENDKYIYLS